jgi:hypothetical protein
MYGMDVCYQTGTTRMGKKEGEKERERGRESSDKESHKWRERKRDKVKATEREKEKMYLLDMHRVSLLLLLPLCSLV